MRQLYTQSSDFYRERDFGQKISATLEFIAGHWRPLGQVLVRVMVPVLLVRSVLQALIQQYLPVEFSRPDSSLHLDGGSMLRLQAGMWRTIFTSLAYWTGSLVGSISFSLLIVSVYGYLVLLARRGTPGAPPTVAEVWGLMRREFLGTFLALWGVGLLVGLGFLFLAIPGIYLSVVVSLFFIVKLSEGIGFGAAFSRCWLLISDKWWSTFGLIAIALLLYYVVLVGIGGVAVLVSGGFAALMQAARAKSPLGAVVISCLTSLSTLLLYTPLLLALAFQYFNLVERREGTGLRLMINTLGQTAPPQVSNAAYQPHDEGEY